MSLRIHHGTRGFEASLPSPMLLNRCLQRLQTGFNIYRAANEAACHAIGEGVLAAGLAQKAMGR